MKIRESKKELDLKGVIAPVCMLKCKSELTRMDVGDVLEVLLQDPEAVEELAKIIERSNDRVISKEREDNHYRIRVKKGSI